ncbi:hypothetical protein CEUSTIGMA_g5676.t1 [Chlamydomonas eustigma]|uniref:Uncharacterized protein n=1 Tax=Chlamydomonas eustigma TaxID=1157962 RepID=A0A250X570_9CHLO|nr:hypothetical protein CEUSTIGMA_g5676.t1 [Chlamydomonas eustigma]|eukprot:GAX78234.1 hypothetical protein CEUSTIGMA_g5676.t1 [Chlamydomonas eustigma]
MMCTCLQWLRPKVLYNYGSQIVGGQDGAQAFTFREHTFLDNPRFPGEFRKEELTVVPGEEPCPADGQKTCSAQPVTTNDKGQRVVHVPKSLRQKQLLSVLQPHRDVKILRIQKPMRLFGGFEDIKLKDSFEIFVDKVASNWCCRDKPFIAKGMKEKEKLAITESLTNRVFLDDKKTPMADPPW